jgi:hypothetical protein
MIWSGMKLIILAYWHLGHYAKVLRVKFVPVTLCHHRSHMDWLEIEPEPLDEKPSTNCLSSPVLNYMWFGFRYVICMRHF